MRISGHRIDGALYLSLGAGMAVILRDGVMSPPTDQTIIEKMGPWAPDDDSLEARRAVEKVTSYARVVPVETFSLKGKPKEEVLNLTPDEVVPEKKAPVAEDALIPDVPGKKTAKKKTEITGM